MCIMCNANMSIYFVQIPHRFGNGATSAALKKNVIEEEMASEQL